MTISGISAAGKQRIIDCLIVDDLAGYMNKSNNYIAGYALTWATHALAGSGTGLSKATEDKIGKPGADVIAIEDALIGKLSINAKEKYEEYRDNYLINVKSTEDLKEAIAIVNNDNSLSSQEKTIIADCLIIDDLAGYADQGGSFIPGYALTWAINALNASGIGLSKETEDSIGTPGADVIAIEEELLNGLTAQEKEAYEKLRDTLDRPNDQIDLMDALCRLDSEIGFCPSITTVNPNEIPANTSINVQITGANLPIDGNIEITDEYGSYVPTNAAISVPGSATETEIIATVFVPAAGAYLIKVSDETGRLSATTPITVVTAEESKPTLSIIPRAFRPGEAKNVSGNGANIEGLSDTDPMVLDIVDADDNSVLSGGEISLTTGTGQDKQVRVNKDDGLIIVGNLSGTDKNKAVRIKVAKDTVPEQYTLVLKQKGVELVRQTITVEGTTTAAKKSKVNGYDTFRSWMQKYMRPQARARISLQTPLHNSNPLHQSVVEEQLSNVFAYDVGLTLNPRYQFGSDTANIAIGGTAGFAERTTGGEETAGLQVDGSIVGAYASARANYVYQHHNLDTPSISRVENESHAIETEVTAGYKGKSFAALGIYRNSKRWFDLEHAVFGMNDIGQETTHEIGAELSFRNRSVNTRLEGGYRFGKIDIFDIIDGPVSKKTDGWYLEGGFQHVGWWTNPYVKAAYLSQNHRGNQRQQELDIAAGLNVGSFWIADKNFLSVMYSLKENNPYLPLRQHAVGLEWYMQNVLKLGAQYSQYEVGMPGNRNQDAQAFSGYLDLGPGIEYLLQGAKEQEDPLRWQQ